MIAVHPEYVVDKENHPKAVLLPMTDWEKVVEELEELEDIRAYDKAKSVPGESVPFEQAVREIERSRQA